MMKKKDNVLPMLFPYKHDDKTTWPYIDCNIYDNGEMRKVSSWVKNPDFKYGHLIKGY